MIAATCAVAEPAVELNYSYEPDAHWRLDVTQRFVGSMQINSATALPWDATCTVAVACTCTGVDGNVATVLHRIEKLAVVGQAGAEAINLHLDNQTLDDTGIAPGELTARVGPQGVQEVTGLTPNQGALQMLDASTLLAMPTLPAEPVVVGATWVQSPVGAPRIDEGRSTVYTLQGVEHKDDTRLARISFQTSVDVSRPLQSAPPPASATQAARTQLIPVQLSDVSTGEHCFDLDTGRLVSTERRGKVCITSLQLVPLTNDEIKTVTVTQELDVDVRTRSIPLDLPE